MTRYMRHQLLNITIILMEKRDRDVTLPRVGSESEAVKQEERKVL